MTQVRVPYGRWESARASRVVASKDAIIGNRGLIRFNTHPYDVLTLLGGHTIRAIITHDGPKERVLPCAYAACWVLITVFHRNGVSIKAKRRP